MKPNLRQRFKLLKLAIRYNRLQEEVDSLVEEARDAEGATCGYCGSWRTWKELTDESVQTERRPLICSKCVKRRQIAIESGWVNWPEVVNGDEGT